MNIVEPFRKGPIKILVILFVVGLFIRLIGLESYPVGFHRDEAYLGYNAYSILKTGNDINGNFFPLFLESFLYTPAGYSYFSIPFIKIFGLNVFAVRFASVIFGAFSIPLMFYATRKIVLHEKSKFSKNSTFIALISSFLLAISPWHINLSRTASVSTLVLFFILLGLIFLLKWSDVKKFRYLSISFFSFLVSLSFYIAPYAFLPPFLLLVFLVFKEHFIKKNKFQYLFASIFIVIPIIYVFTSHTLSIRPTSLSLTNDPQVPAILEESIHNDGRYNLPTYLVRVFHNKPIVILDLFAENYFSHLSYNFLFNDSGFPIRYKVPSAGLIYPVLLIFLILGLLTIFKEKWKIRWLLVGWILISPIGSAMSSDDVPNFQRVIFMLPPILIIISIGFLWLINYLKHKSRYLFFIVLGVFTYQVIFYVHQYVGHMNSYQPWHRQEGYKNLAKILSESNYERIVVTNRESAPTIFLMFFNKFDPNLAQGEIKKSSLKDTDRISFDKFEISEEECPLRVTKDEGGSLELIGARGVLYVNSGLCKIEELPNNVKLISTIKRSDESKAFYLLAID